MEFKYRATVVIPVYNRGHLVNTAFDSLLNQTIPFSDMQILIVNDGSTDDSLSICKEIAAPYENVQVLNKSNGGLSSTRNFGLKHAQGKYVIYLDDDDELTEDTVLSLVNFFDAHYDEIDLVTYKIMYYTDGKRATWHHSRYNILTESGVYDLNEFPQIIQTTINVCIKNKFEDNVMFLELPNFHMEDQAYNNAVLKEKMKIGYCEIGEYKYHQHKDSIVATKLFPLYCYDNVIGYFEKQFSEYEKVPPYFQNMFIHNLNFRFKGNKLFPNHLEGEEYEKEVARISNLLRKVDDEQLLSFTAMDEYHKVFFLNMKPNRDVKIELASQEQTISKNGEIYIFRTNATLVSKRFFFDGDSMRIIGYMRSPFFVYTEKPKVYAKDEKTGKVYPLELYPSSFNYYYVTHECAKNWSFDFKLPLENISELKFFIEMNGLVYDVIFEFETDVAASKSKPVFVFEKNGTRLKFSDHTFFVKKISKFKHIVKFARKSLKLFFKSPKYTLTYWGVLWLKKTPIWLYNDNLFTVKDNGFYQFVHDFEKEDGIKRYFITDGDESRFDGVFTQEQKKNLVRFGSKKHKLLFLACEKILTSFCEASSFTPLIRRDMRLFFEEIDFEVIYLQHGILHATTPTKYSKDRVKVDRIVVSSHFEMKNFVENYGYNTEDLIPTGMARYDYTDLTKKPKKLILYAPSWRDGLIGKYVDRQRKYYDGLLKNSNYYKGIVDFISDPVLLESLEKNDVCLELKLHPNFVPYSHLFDDFINDRVRLAAANVPLEDYSLFITDFSSFNFDFLYQNRQLLYYVPDYVEFKAGVATFYKDLDLKFEDGFGDVAFKAEDAVNYTIKRIEQNFSIDPKFKERIDNFFLEKGNHCQRLYDSLMKK